MVVQEGSSTSAGSSTHGGYGEDTQHQHLAASRASQDEAATPLPEPNSRQASDAQLLSSALSPAQSTSSYGSELATPSAPLLAASTPFFTPLAPNNTTVRRVTRHHGAPSPLVPPQPGPAFDDATSLLGRLDSVQKLLDDSLVEVDHRLAASPLVKGAVHDPRPDTSAPLISETSEAESYATALQSAGASSSDMGAWVGADEAESGQSRPVEPTGLSAQQADSDSVADAMAEVLTLESGIAGTAAKANGTSAPVSPASKAMSRSSTMGRDDVVTTSPLDHDGDLGTLTPGSQASTTDNGNVLRITAPDVDPSKPLQGGDLLRLYMGAQVPRPGQVLLFQPDPVLQAMVFRRADVADTLRTLGLRCDAAALPDVEAAQYLGPWAIATLCRCMSVDNILSYLSAALLERQVVVFCPNVGLLTGIVFSLVPALLPFTWHSLMLPVLPAAPPHLDLLDAPVPFVMGVVYKTPDIRSRCGGLVRVNVYKDRIKNAGALPALPQQAALADALAGAHAEIRRMGQSRAAETRPVHVVSDAQQVLANCFLSTLQTYLKGLVADLKGYTITDVTAGGGDTRVSVLLKDSFVESFPPRDRPFMRQFAETQMFSMYCDSVI